MASAEDEAADLGFALVGTEHVLLGLLRQADAKVMLCLDAWGVTLNGVRWDVAVRVPATAPDGPPVLALETERVIELARVAADRRGHPTVLPSDLLLAAVFVRGEAAQILAERGADAFAVRDLLDRA